MRPKVSSKSAVDTRTRIIDLGEKLLRQRGYNAFSFKDIAEGLDIRPAAVHYHFPTKADLGGAILDKEIAALVVHKQNWKNLRADEQLVRLVAVFSGHRQRGFACLMGALSPDYEDLPPVMQTNLKTYSRNILTLLTPLLSEGREAGVLRFEGAAADRALLFVSALMAALLISRVEGADTFDRITQQLLKDLIVC
jgi:TetR/AcrR family transcriptional regulator, transcriptional repressor for nem operon